MQWYPYPPRHPRWIHQHVFGVGERLIEHPDAHGRQVDAYHHSQRTHRHSLAAEHARGNADQRSAMTALLWGGFAGELRRLQLRDCVAHQCAAADSISSMVQLLEVSRC
jgi:hypothetical protein